MNSKLKIVVPLVLLAVLGVAYKTVLAKPKDGPAKKVEGEVYVLPRDFLVNLRDGEFAKFNVGLVVPKGAADPPKDKKKKGKPPEGFGTMPQEALIRDLVTDTVTGMAASRLISSTGRKKLKKRIERRIKAHTDVKVKDVLITDVAVQ